MNQAQPLSKISRPAVAVFAFLSAAFSNQPPNIIFILVADMSADMTETRDLAKENSEVVQRLSQLLQNWYAESYAF